jgi:hypothetical protein
LAGVHDHRDVRVKTELTVDNSVDNSRERGEREF